MTVSFSDLRIGAQYDRPELASIWGYKSFQAISRGVVTPAATNFIVLFVTEEKQQSLTQYNDHIEGQYLHWEGEAKHGSDRRIVDARQNGDEIHLFHRKVHHSPFLYLGKISLLEHNLLEGEPSQFIFSLTNEDDVEDKTGDYEAELLIDETGLVSTERNAIIKSRIGQGVFRDGLFRLWGGCAVTGYRRPVMLIASHIKPWRTSSNKERLDPYNGLLLHPTLDRLFDRGLITFYRDGSIVKSNHISNDELVSLGVDPMAKLRKVPENTTKYLAFHRENEFESTSGSTEDWRIQKDW